MRCYPRKAPDDFVGWSCFYCSTSHDFPRCKRPDKDWGLLSLESPDTSTWASVEAEKEGGEIVLSRCNNEEPWPSLGTDFSAFLGEASDQCEVIFDVQDLFPW